MKFIPIGIIDTKHNIPVFMRVSDFGNDRYDGVELRSDKKCNPVIVMRSKSPDTLPWKVAYSFSQIYFRTFEDAIAFCNSRGFRLVKEQVN